MALKQQNLAIEPETIKGTIYRTRYHNPENGYCVLMVIIDDHDPVEITAVGHLPAVREGDEYELTGSWVTDPKWGRQFKFETARVILPTGARGVAKYLSGVTHGVGIKKAKRIVEQLGDDALQKIQADPTVLYEMTYLSEAQCQEIAQNIRQNSVRAELAGMICVDGIGEAMVNKVMAKYGNDAIKVIKENPYVLADDLWGVGFKKADRIAATAGVKPNSPYRVKAALDYALQEAGNEGHVFLRPNHIVHKLIGRKGLIEASGVSVQDVSKANQELIQERKCVREGDAVYSADLYGAECGLALSVRRLLEQPKKKISHLEEMTRGYEHAAGIDLAPEQRSGVAAALTEPLSIVTGGPGTGKTTLLDAVCSLFIEFWLAGEVKQMERPDAPHLYLCSPTGRAAKRMQESTGFEHACTIHRLLGYRSGKGFEFGPGNPLPGPGLIVVDEASMLDVELAHQLFSACTELQVMLVGDVDQLPSVGPGNVLRDMIECGRVPVTRLQFNYRQAGGSKVAEYANLVRDGQLMPLESDSDFRWFPVDTPEEAVMRIARAVKAIVRDGWNQMDWQVLAPMRKGACGVNELNKLVRNIVNPASEKKPELGPFRLGDKVMVIKNNYNLGVFNGDLGEVVRVGKDSLKVDFGSFDCEFNRDNLGLLVLAYASTVHKAQGCEFKIVLMPLVRQHYVMLQRNLLYTGMTRARERLVLISDEWAVKRAVENSKIAERHSYLAQRIRGEM